MSGLEDLGRLLIVVGLVVVGIGLVILLAGRIPLLGNLPGDLRFQSGGVSCFIPLATSLLLSLILSVVLTLLANLLQRR